MIHQGKSSYQNEITDLKRKVDLLERGKNSYDAQMEVRFNNSVEDINTDYQEQISKLTTTIQEVTLTNKDLQEKNNRLRVMSALKDYEE